MLAEGLSSIKNTKFLQNLKAQFPIRCLNISQDELKQFSNPANPLINLLRIQKQLTTESSPLIDDLIEITCGKFQFNIEDILHDTFERPTRASSTYRILFDEDLSKLNLRTRIIESLKTIWQTWTKQGLLANQILKWTNLSQDEKDIVQRFWELLAKTTGSKYNITRLIAKQKRAMDKKICIKENITKCLEIYCSNARDQADYLKYLAQIDKGLNSDSVRLIEIPDTIHSLLPMAIRLNPLEKIYAWRTFLLNNRNRSSKTTDPSSPEVIDSDRLLSDETIGSISNPITTMQSLRTTRKSIENLTCLEILKEDIQILDEFTERLKKIYGEWRTSPISDLLDFFPDIQYVDHDFEILKRLFKPDNNDVLQSSDTDESESDDAESPTLNDTDKSKSDDVGDVRSDDIDGLKSILDYWKSRDFIRTVCNGYILFFNSFNKLTDDECRTIQDLVNVTEQTEGIACSHRYQKFNLSLTNVYTAEFIHFLREYFHSNELIHFINSLSSGEVDNLLQAVSDWDETLINTNTILDFVKIKQFFVQLNRQIELLNENPNPYITFQERLSEIFTNLFSEEQFKNLFSYFESCRSSLASIKHIHLNLTDKELAKRKRISDLMRNITFDFVREHQSFDISIQPQMITMNDLSELRDRARLIEYSKNTNKITEKIEFQTFVKFVEIVEKFLKHLNQLNIAGHPLIDDYLRPKKIFTCVKGNYKELIEFSLKLDDLLADWEKDLCQIYEKYIDLTYFSYQQFWIIEDYLYHHQKNSNKTHFGYHLLKNIGIQPEDIRVEYLPLPTTNVRERLENLGKILTAQRHSISLLYKQENANVKKISLIETTDDGILRSILSLFEQFKQKSTVNHLFFCTEQTTWMEIRAFTYRCFRSQNLHQLIRPELLSAAIQNDFTRLLTDLIHSNSQHYFRLGIITTILNTELQLINSLRTLQIVQKLQENDLLDIDLLKKTIEGLLNENSIYVTSIINGLGKTFYIEKQIKSDDKTYIKFPISGDIDVDQLAERLCQHGDKFSQSALHIDIGPINDRKEFNQMLYCLLLFRSYRFQQVAISIPNDMPIYIELDSSPNSYHFLENNSLFKYMKRYSIEAMHWNEFELTQSNSLPVQFVVNYLHALKDKSILKTDLNETNLTMFSKEICIDLLKEQFLKDKKPEFINWTQLSIFIFVYYNLFSGFSKCGFFLVDAVRDRQTRVDILNELLDSSNQFTSLCVDTVRQNQRSTQSNNEIADFSSSIVRWDKTKPFTLVFSDSHVPIFVYKQTSAVPKTIVQAFQFYYQALTNNENQDVNQMFPDYNKFTHEEFFQKLVTLSKKFFIKAICKICYKGHDVKQTDCLKCSAKGTLAKPSSSATKHIDDFQILFAQRIRREYVLTADNFIKMLLIYLRVQSGLPVLIMGETGCGKTALIQFLCQKILDDEMEIFHIHAGVTSDDICQQFQAYIEKANLCAEENKRLWIFLDEFNTTPSIGLLKEITCERTLLGQQLPKNIVILGACNPPRRKRETAKLDKDNIGIKKDHYELTQLRTKSNNSLLYTVVSIPETMLEYVWDYGFLEKDIERKYIDTMLNTCGELKKNSEWFDVVVESICQSQEFFRQLEDVSSVSLRDVARFCRLYNWFYQSITKREGENKAPTLVRRSSLLALLLCYYYRLNSPQDRKDYVTRMETILSKILTQIAETPNFLIRILDGEQRKLIEKMQLPPGTAKNRALMDNIFVLLVCIINRIPVIICGKPGCSKTSAVQIVINNLKGQQSQDPYFQTLPELVTVSYQGSQNCTSDSIIKVFQRADKYLHAKDDANRLPVVVFDEIGLAELSPHNPLKVLHGKLEVETCQYGFVGLSNWRLDASKMNRALYLSCTDPDVDDLKLTAQIISKSMIPQEGQLNRIDNQLIDALAVSYFELYEELKKHPDKMKYTNYFGLRDFYSLIKGVVRDLLENEAQSSPYECILQQLVINFDGMLNGSEYLWMHFCEHIHRIHLLQQFKPPTFKQLLDRRLTSRQGRYLMLIAENESVIDYVERYILVQQQSSSVRTLIGSSFSGDLIAGQTYTEQYNYRVLMDVILYAETNVTLIMRRMRHLYDNLYDLFNQNFAVSGKKNYCRIALGALYHPRCLVNDDFYCIVFVRKSDLDKCDPPFLNRFEKHLVDMKSLVHERIWLITTDLLNQLVSLLPTNLNKYFPLLQHLFVDYSNDYICNLVIDAFEQLQLSIHDDTNTSQIIEFCLKRLMQTSSFDLPLILSLQTDGTHRSFIDQYYDVHTNLSFESVLQQALAQDALTHQIIYTYTQFYQTIDYPSDEIEEVLLSIFKTEVELTNKIKEHYQQQDNQRRLLLIRVDYHQEHEHVLLLKHILLNTHASSSSNSKRGIWLIFHLQRNLLNQTENEVLFNGWPSIMINDLKRHRFVPKEILLNPSYIPLVSYEDFVLSECNFDELIERCLTKFRYTVSQNQEITTINRRRNLMVKNLSEKSALRQIIETNLMKLISQQSLKRFNDWRRDLLTNGILIGTCRSLNDALQMTISIFYESYLVILLGHLEKFAFIDTFLAENSNQHFAKIWLDCLNTTLESIDTSIINLDMIDMPLIFNLHYPCAGSEYEIIRSIRQVVLDRTDENTNEDDLMQLALKQLRNKSIYGTNIDLILNDQTLFDWYLSDQLILAQEESKIYDLSSDFLFRLITMNPTRTYVERLKLILINFNELFKIFRLFEISTKLINENDFQQLLNRQLIVLKENDNRTIENDSSFYNLILTNENFYLLPPRQRFSPEQKTFQCQDDAFIETSLMNLIEYLVSSKVIKQVKNIEHLTTTYSLVAQSIMGLRNYSVDNLEKLRSFISLIRCITTLISSEKSLDVLRDFNQHVFADNQLETCKDIHHCIDRLRQIIQSNHPTTNESNVQRTLLKLESELLKDWLFKHNGDYLELIRLLSQPQNELWQYSGKIFQSIDQTLQFREMIELFDGQIPSTSDDEGVQELIDIYQQFDECLRDLNDSKQKIEHLFTTRIHMRLIVNFDDTEESILQYLQDKFQQFQDNVNALQIPENQHGSKLICLISWIKFYVQLYAIGFFNGINDPILLEIDQYLTRNESLICSTIKLFLIKQLRQMLKTNQTLQGLKEHIQFRNITWLPEILNSQMSRQNEYIRSKLVLPMPLFECREDFMSVDRILTDSQDVKDIQKLLSQCRKSQSMSYSFLMWFIHYYARFYLNNDIGINNKYQQIIENDLTKEIIECFDRTGYKFLVFLCRNFSDSSYFQLNSQMTVNQVHQRLFALNIIAFLLSTKALSHATYFSSLLFDGNLKMPEDYAKHIQTSVCLPGLIPNDPVLTQMLDVKKTVKERLDQNVIHEPGKYIYRCSEDCLWMFYFVNCGVPVARSICPLCHKDIGAQAYGVLIERDPPQIRLKIDEAFKYIESYIEKYNKTPRFGYRHFATTDVSTKQEKSDHLNGTISYRFHHLLTHVVLLFLNDLSFIQTGELAKPDYFREHYEKDFELLSQQTTDNEDSYIWLYKLLNHLLSNDFICRGSLNTNERVMQLEKLLEEKLIFAHLNSIGDEITEYKTSYTAFIRRQNEETSLENFVDELNENELKYPFLSYFNVTNIYTKNPLDEFRRRLESIPFSDIRYPVTNFLLKRLDDFQNIQYLHPIIVFTNYLIEKFNHRIKRNDASETPISHYLTDSSDSDFITQYYEQFVDAWYKLELKEVRYNCQTPKFERHLDKIDFARHTKLAMVLLNTSKDDSSILLAACLKTLGELQNEIVQFFHHRILQDTQTNPYEKNAIPLQSIRSEYVLKFDANYLSLKLLGDGFTINYLYGKSQDIIFDFEQMELTLRNLIGSLPLLDTSQLHFLNYQFELYSENTSLINDVRKQIQQDPYPENDKFKLKNFLISMKNDDILNCLGSIDHIFTYLRNIDNEENINSWTIQSSIENCIRLPACFRDNILQKQPFATIQLKYLIDIYELIEEIAYDQVLRHYIKQDLNEENFSEDERKKFVADFVSSTYEKANIAPSLKTVQPWIAILKRIMVRVLSNVNVLLDVSLQIYLERTDLWTGNITEMDIQTFEVPEPIYLQHTYIILRGLESKLQPTIMNNTQTKELTPQKVNAQIDKAQSWRNSSIKASIQQGSIKPARPGKPSRIVD